MSRTSGAVKGVYTVAINNKPLKKRLVGEYLNMDNPPSLKQWLRDHHMRKRTFDRLHGEIAADTEARTQAIIEIEEAKKRAGTDKLGRNLRDDSDRWQNVENAIYQKALDGTVSAQELYAKVKGKLKDELEIKVGRLQDDDYYRIRNEASREIASRGRSKGDGDREVLPESALLLEEPCLDTKQDNQENS
jgi:hypothetical protein